MGPKAALSWGKKYQRKTAGFFASRKEGIIAGASDNDPSGVITYLQVGATNGLSQLWLLILSTPMLIAVEEMAARAGVVLKKGLGRVIAARFGRRLAGVIVAIVAIANIATIGADLAGMAEVTEVIFGSKSQFIYFVLLIGLAILLILLRGRYRSVSRYLLFLTPFFLAYVISAIIAQPDWREVLASITHPRINMDLNYWALAVAMLGTTITPYVMFWENTEEVEGRSKVGEIPAKQTSVRIGMIFSNVVACFIVILAATLFFGHGGALENLGQAAEVLQPLVGNASFGLFGAGILAAGFLAVPILTASTAYMLSDAFGWQAGLDRPQYKAPTFYMVILTSIVLGIFIAWIGVSPVQMIVWSQVLDGLVVPFLILGLMIVTNDDKLMGKYVNPLWVNIVGGITILAMVTAGYFMVLEWIK